MTTESDARLAIAQLYDAYTPALLRYLKRLTGSREEAEELVQEAFLKALRHWEQLETNTNAHAWLFRIARNAAYDSFRRRRRGPILEQGEPELDRLPPPSAEADLGDLEAVRVTLRHLPPRYRVPLMLHSVEGYPLDAIADALGWKLGTVKSRLHCAQTQFRARYAVP